jgi:PIN domain nuclease of toxin-antitoxin system
VNVLLDTHTLLWYYLDDPQLSRVAQSTIEDPVNRVFVRPASHWEIAIKLSTGKYTLHVPFPTFVQEAIYDNCFTLLPIEPRHSAELVAMTYHHRDPFDRMIVAQAIVEDMPIISVDSALDAYPIRRIWT